MYRANLKMFKRLFWSIILTACIQTAKMQHFALDKPQIRVNKCCEPYEIQINNNCVHINETNETMWRPIFTTENGQSNVQVDYL